MSSHPTYSVPPDLRLPETLTQAITDWRSVVPGQLIEFSDGQQVLVLALHPQAKDGLVLSLFRVAAPRIGGALLGECFALPQLVAERLLPFKVLGAWYGPTQVPKPDRVLLEAIRRGFITARSCGVPWPQIGTMKLSEQATARIETYLFEVARSTGCAFPFNDIAQALGSMYLSPRTDNPALCDIVEQGEDPLTRHAKGKNDDLLGLWARELRRRIHMSDWVPPTL